MGQPDLDDALIRHPYLKDRQHYEREHNLAQIYLKLKSTQFRHGLQLLSQSAIAEHFGIHQSQVSNWLNDRTRPKLLNAIQAHETARTDYEAKLAPEAHLHRIDPSTVYHTFRPIGDHLQRQSPELLATAIASLYKQTDTHPKVLFAELHPYHECGPTWLRQFEPIIHQYRHTIETHLNTHETPHTAIRIGVVKNVLYLWHENTDPHYWLNLWNQEFMHFHSPKQKQELVLATCRHLGLTNETETYTTGHRKLTQLLAQFNKRPLPLQKYGTYPELSKVEPFLKGNTLQFFLDATNQSFTEVKTQISHIGFREGGYIRNPKFPDIEILQAHLLATMLSDGHLDEKRVIYYVEKDPERRQRVKELINEVGNVQYNEEGNRLRIPVPVGRLLENLGLPVGDKSQQQIPLPEAITNGSNEVKIAYLQELIPEDGSFHQGRFSWSRSIVMVSPSNPDFVNKLDQEHLDLIKEFGTRRIDDYGFEDYDRVSFTLKYSTIQELCKNENQNTSQVALDLIERLEMNPPLLMRDEVKVARSLGMNIDMHPEAITIFTETGRISARWSAATKGYSSGIRWALMAPPNHARKRNAVAEWLATHFVKPKK